MHAISAVNFKPTTSIPTLGLLYINHQQDHSEVATITHSHNTRVAVLKHPYISSLET